MLLRVSSVDALQRSLDTEEALDNQPHNVTQPMNVGFPPPQAHVGSENSNFKPDRARTVLISVLREGYCILLLLNIDTWLSQAFLLCPW